MSEVVVSPQARKRSRDGAEFVDRAQVDFEVEAILAGDAVAFAYLGNLGGPATRGARRPDRATPVSSAWDDAAAGRAAYAHRLNLTRAQSTEPSTIKHKALAAT